MEHNDLGIGPVVEPAARPRKSREAARVVIVSADGRALLGERYDPGLPSCRWWTAMGGGIDAGETPREAAIREVWEETGRRVAADDLVGPVAHRVVTHGYSDQVVDQAEWYFLLAVPEPFEPRAVAPTERELVSSGPTRWCRLADLGLVAERTAAGAWVWDDVAALWGLRDREGEWVVDLGHVEQSSVPVD